jgi:hypothetical protein
LTKFQATNIEHDCDVTLETAHKGIWIYFEDGSRVNIYSEVEHPPFEELTSQTYQSNNESRDDGGAGELIDLAQISDGFKLVDLLYKYARKLLELPQQSK